MKGEIEKQKKSEEFEFSTESPIEQHVLDGFDEISKVEATDQEPDEDEAEVHPEEKNDDLYEHNSDDDDGERVDDLESGQIFDMGSQEQISHGIPPS